MWAVVETYYKYAEYTLRFVKTESEMRDFLFATLQEYNYEGTFDEEDNDLDLEGLIDLVVELGNKRVERQDGWGVREITKVPKE